MKYIETKAPGRIRCRKIARRFMEGPNRELDHTEHVVDEDFNRYVRYAELV